MWRRVFRPHVTHDEQERFVIAPHHPDRLLRPPVSLVAASDERFQQALIWNVFRTLELVTPSFWLRRFHLRLTGDPSIVPPQIASVHLWRRLPLPAIQRIDGARPDVVADVVIETEHAVWTLVAESTSRDVTDSHEAAGLVDAGAWYAGAREHHCGVIASSAARVSMGSVLQSRYARSRESIRLRSATRGPATPARVTWGTIGWPDLSALLQECAEADNLPTIERALARNAREWVTRVGIDRAAGEVAQRAASG